jgi:hypothetical protein
MKKFLFFLLFLPLTIYSEEKADSTKFWKISGLTSVNLSQVSLTNWSTGGKSSSSGVALFNLNANYLKDKISWENTLNMGYGLLKENGKDVVKTHDKFDLISKYGVKQSEKIYISTLFNFKTQFAPGYSDSEDKRIISDFMAPAYLTLSPGLDYKPNKKLSFLISPVTGKMTIVANDSLSSIGAFGVDPGKSTRYEFGSFLKMELKTDLMKNVSLQTKLDLFSNYLHNPENIDVNWDLLINMKINDYLSANLITNLIYDDDVKIDVDKNNDGIIEASGARVQFKEMFGVGLSLKF